MSEASDQPTADSNQERHHRIDRICDEFERSWRAGNRQDLRSILGRADVDAALVRELLRVELELRRTEGEIPTADEYLERLPEWKSLVAELLKAPVNRGVASPEHRRALHIRCPHCTHPVEVVETAEDEVELTCPTCGSHFSLVSALETRSSRLRPPRQLAHFELIEQVGVGAFGAVWKARDTQLDRIVAIKIPRHEQVVPGDVDRFIREARAAAQLKHPRIVQVHEVGREGSVIYIVSDFVDGVTLTDRLTSGRLTVGEAAELIAKIAESLAHAHAAGVIHRDLKPSNIMLDGADEPHLMDFGLAKRAAGEITVTTDGAVLGTPAYMSPEQARGDAHRVDGRSDVYSLGVIFYQLLTGELPYSGNARMLLHQVLHDEPKPPRARDKRIPRDLETSNASGANSCTAAMTKHFPPRPCARIAPTSAAAVTWPDPRRCATSIGRCF